VRLVGFERHRERERGVGLHANGCMHSQEVLFNEVLWTLPRHISSLKEPKENNKICKFSLLCVLGPSVNHATHESNLSEEKRIC
jgi:hypothetical protein